jgi:hypothetical protein
MSRPLGVLRRLGKLVFSHLAVGLTFRQFDESSAVWVGQERPELRTGFKYPDLRKQVRASRGRLLSAALTIISGWYAEGRPTHGLPSWGSFESWSGVVREVVVFAGLNDPGASRLALQTATDRDATAIRAILVVLEHMDPDRRGVTTAAIINLFG